MNDNNTSTTVEKKTPSLDQVGEIDVQSGQILIADPCLITGVERYDKIVNSRNIGTPSEVSVGRKVVGVCVDTIIVDKQHKCPVFVKRDTEGKPVEMTIKLGS